jgi:MFS family permease
LTMIPMSIGWPLGAAWSGRIMAKTGIRTTSLVGVAGLLVSTACLAMITLQTPHWSLFVITFLTGFGFGFAYTSFTGAVLDAVEWNLRGAAMAANTFIRTLGQTLGIAAFGTLLNHAVLGAGLPQGVDVNKILSPEAAHTIAPELLRSVREVLASGLHQVFVVLAVLTVASFLVTLWYPRKPMQQREVS